jgi:hypothetical protein
MTSCYGLRRIIYQQLFQSWGNMWVTLELFTRRNPSQLCPINHEKVKTNQIGKFL